jgi:hypothetical protein
MLWHAVWTAVNETLQGTVLPLLQGLGFHQGQAVQEGGLIEPEGKDSIVFRNVENYLSPRHDIQLRHAHILVTVTIVKKSAT